MSEVFTYICVKSSNDVFIPPVPTNLLTLGRDVSDAFVALQGGYMRVGQLAFFPAQRSVPYHLLCDGKEVPKGAFPELYEFLGDQEGTPADADNFLLPNYVGALEPAPVAEPEVFSGGTASSTPPPPTPPPEPPAGGSLEYYIDIGSATNWATIPW